MGLYDSITHQSYYQGNDLGNYQFVSLKDIMNQFMVAYVGENKIIPKIKKADVLFHAQRALQELSFDTITSFKSQQIEVPPSLVMPIPHDYVNYTKISSVDNSGIKHVLYPTKYTSNPFQIKQSEGDLNYSFPSGEETLANPGFTDLNGQAPENWIRKAVGNNHGQANFASTTGIVNGKLTFGYRTRDTSAGEGWSQISLLYQQVDVSSLTFADLSGDGVTSDITYQNTILNTNSGTAVGTIRLGITTQDPSVITNLNNHADYVHPVTGVLLPQSPFGKTSYFDLGYVEWTGNDSGVKTLEDVDLTNHNTIYVVALSFIDASEPLENGFILKPVDLMSQNPLNPARGLITGTGNINTLDDLSLVNSFASTELASPLGNEQNSSTWNNYKSHTASENTINDYQDYENNVYWPNEGERYGLDPEHAQINGSFYIDQRLGRIHFSSVLSGQNIILDYISDGLGTEDEMKVHKFAEEAMYKSIAYAVLSTSNYGQSLVPRFKKEKFAETRKAKLRLSSFKLEELTQILRGKSKQIKH